MAPEISELIAALPADLEQEPTENENLESILEEIGKKRVPVGRFTRFWLLGGLQAKIALAYLAWWLRQKYVRGDSAAHERNEVHMRNSLRLLSTMGYMRGTIMKIGQMLASYPSILPEQFANMLGVLHFDAPPMHYSLIREHIINELGDSPENLFEHFEEKAFAAASLGQVHRATLKSGAQVAVKIQYPNIARTIQDDFRNLNTAIFPMRLSRDWDNMKAQWSDICRQLEYECDYEREAGWLKQARLQFTEADRIVVPRVFDEFSTKRILTMEYLDGLHLPAYVETNPSQAERDRYGELIFQSMTRLYYQLRIMYADPHPGNYLFLSDGRLGLIDFGCCRSFSDDEWRYLLRVEETSGYDADNDALTETLVQSIDFTSRDQVKSEQLDMVRNWCRWQWEPWQVEDRFNFGDRDYLDRGIELLGTMMRRGYTRSKSVNTWVNRAFIGIRTILYRLDARINVRRILDEETCVR